ncbi:MAG: DUF4091 domain-containing protein [Clostridiaceae bacterium]|nr:DUF4091 domain-containing protein [Clostridiaceae bacterium]
MSPPRTICILRAGYQADAEGGFQIVQAEKLEIRLLSSLEKVFADEDLKALEWKVGSMLLNEVYSFQVAYRWNDVRSSSAVITISSELSGWITVRKVGLAPSEFPCYGDHDDYVLRTTPGLYPDILLPLKDESAPLVPLQWRSLWITVKPGGMAKAGIYPIIITFTSPSGDELGKAEFRLEIINASLPEQSLIYTQWFHTDCLSTWYNAEVFSDRYWRIVKNYLETAVNHGISMILTPLFTPPLDTDVGSERPTVQLVDVEVCSRDHAGAAYKFGFERLRRWVDICLAVGIKYFELSHLFTQWGAKHAPKIMACKNGEYKRIFGWETDASGKEYRSFLSQFLPELINFINHHNLKDRVYFHVSDEPHMDHYESYKNAASAIYPYIEGFPVIDALSDYKFYETGLVKNPIPATDHIEPFLENKVPNLWTYYCCSQYKEVSNRFFNMPSARNRILGTQLYKYNIAGFLQWGYNFWYSLLSRYPIDPYKVTDASHSFPSGDAFLVYPGEDEKPLESLRFEVFYEGLQDMRTLKLLESHTGYEETVNLLEKGLGYPITFKKYPRDAGWLLHKREEINRMIAGFIG